jgi:hypothetical protein
MVKNFSHEHIVLPKATVLGVAEEIAEILVVRMSSTGKQRTKSCFNTSIDARKDKAEFDQYIQDRLGHLAAAERSVIEPVLWKYRSVFHKEGSNDFPCTDLVEHRIITGDARPIKKRPYRVPFALREEMETQIQDMLERNVIEESSSAWSSPVVLVPKKSTDGKPKYRFCVDFRALNAVTNLMPMLSPCLTKPYLHLRGENITQLSI